MRPPQSRRDPPTPAGPPGDAPPPRHRARRILARLALVLALLVLIAGAAAVAMGAVVYRRYARGVPEIPTLAQYRPPVATALVSSDGQLVGELFEERRTVVPYERIPRRLVQALVASEDKSFFEHHGIDWLGTLRAAWNTYVLRHRVQGGSTISQQTAKSILVSAEGFEAGTQRNLRRKLRELVLTRRLEAAFDKQQILWLYLNSVFLGHHSYGVEAAAENYFHKDVEQLTLGEAALLAGLPQAPSKYSPWLHPEAAKQRRRYVLRRMYEEGAITAEERASAEREEVLVYPLDDLFREIAPFYAEQVRRSLVDRYGNDRVLHDGLRVELAMDLEKQRAAQAAMLAGLMEVDHRQGWLGPVAHVEGADREALLARLAHAWPELPEPGEYAVAVVAEVDDGAALARLLVGKGAGVLPIAGMRWARKPNPERNYPDALISRPSVALTGGDVVLVRRATREELLSREPKARQRLVPEAKALFTLEQEPKLQGALVSIEPFTGHVVAMVGGYDFDASEFNRALQACRQPGSAFKPIVYSAAIEKLNYTPATLITDAPVVYRDEESGVSWKPSNFGNTFKGEVTLRDALVHSMNLPAVKTAAALGVDSLVGWAREVGLETPVKRELGSAIGSSCTTLWSLAGVYALLDRYGEKRPSTLVKRVADRDGLVLEDHTAPDDPWAPLSARLSAAAAEVQRPVERAMDPRTAYITVSLLQEVATVGTGAQAAKLGRPAAAKTGTTNDSFDTWFMGFTRDLLAGVWLGYDQNELPLGRYETGGRAALPIWLDYMKAALRSRPQPEFPVPDGVELVAIDPDTGKLARPGGKSVTEPFKVESKPPEEPEDGLPGKPKVEVQDLFNE